MAWILLILAGILEVAWAFGLKKYGLKLSLGSAITVAGVILSFWMLSVAMNRLPLGIAYPVWTGIGAVGSAIAGMVFLGEAKDALRIICILMIIGGIVGLKAFSPVEAPAVSENPPATVPAEARVTGPTDSTL